MTFPKVFIIILNWNGLKDTLECLESVFRMDYPNFEVITVDNGSVDDSVEMIRQKYLPVILIENKKNLGFTGGNNIGMRYAMEHGADFIWLLNNDTLVERDSLSKLVAASANSLEIGLLSPVIYFNDGSRKVQFCGSYVDSRRHKLIYPADADMEVDSRFKSGTSVCLWGTALLIKRSLVDNIGYLNDRFYAYWEDTDYSLRAIKAGFRNCVECSAAVYHKNRPPGKGIPNKAVHYYYYKMRNEYYFWSQYERGMNKITYFMNYLADVIEHSANYKCTLGEIYSGACFQGGWDAIRGIDGPWDKNVRMPIILGKLLLWHPYLLGGLLRLDMVNIVREIIRRSILRIMGML